ncbi:MAG: hypothetical protein ACJ705_07255 [Nitrososphaeraceae archaeon]
MEPLIQKEAKSHYSHLILDNETTTPFYHSINEDGDQQHYHFESPPPQSSITYLQNRVK